MPCDIEEADERIFLHVKHIAQEYPKILIKTVDSDVVVIALSVFHRILGISELWIEFGTGKISDIFQFIKSLQISDW